MSTEQNKALVRRMVEEIFNRETLVRPTSSWRPTSLSTKNSPGIPSGREGVKQSTAMMRSAFSDFKATIDDMIAEGDKVVIRQTWSGTQKGEFMGVPPTGKSVSFGVIDILRMARASVWNIGARWIAWD
jgi:predicted ester cyclase